LQVGLDSKKSDPQKHLGAIPCFKKIGLHLTN
jgi:hypothetical protein